MTKFVGAYPKVIKEVLTTSAVSGENAMLLSSPGWGKTEMALQTALGITKSKDNVIFLELDPATPPEVVRGSYDPAQALQGKLVRMLENTPYDPKARIVILDELWRANDVLFDALVHATSNKMANPVTKPVFWGTSNFTGKAERVAALQDRFAIWYYLSTPDLEIKSIVSAHLNDGDPQNVDGDWAIDLPELKTIESVRQAKPSQSTVDAIQEILYSLADEAMHQSFSINPRRIVQWTAMVYRMGVLETGKSDFTDIPMRARRILRWAYPCPDANTASKWAEVSRVMEDSIGAAIEAYRAEAINKFRKVFKQSDASARAGQVAELGMMLANAESELIKIGGKDARVQEVMSELSNLFGRAVRGEKID